MKDKIVVVTGATSGVGKETAIGLALLGAKLILPARNRQKAQVVKEEILEISGNSHVQIYDCDLASFASIKTFSNKVHLDHTKIDILINNAGIFSPTFQQSKDGIELTFAVNHLSYFLLTHLLIDLILASPQGRIINVSSKGHKKGRIHFSDVELMRYYTGFKAYRQSKLANVLFTKSLAERLSNTSVTVNALHPGVIRTNITHELSTIAQKIFNLIAKPAYKGAETPIYLACSPDVRSITGQYFDKMKISKMGSAARSEKTAERLWTMSMEMCEIDKFLPVQRKVKL